MIKCLKCNSIVDETRVPVCPKCGTDLIYGEDVTNIVESSTFENRKKTVLYVIAGVGIALLILFYAFRMLLNLSGFTGYNNADAPSPGTIYDNYNKVFEDNETTAHIENYVPGICDNGHYMSKHFGLQYNLEGLTICDHEDYAEFEKQVYENSIKSAREELEANGFHDQEYLKKWEDAYYNKMELVALWNDGNSVYGEIDIGVVGIMGKKDIDDAYIESMMDGVKSSFEAAGVESVSFKRDKIAEQDCFHLSGKTLMDNESVNINQYYIAKDGMVLMITIKDASSEDVLNKHFRDNVSPY